jgi:hypothetical protein
MRKLLKEARDKIEWYYNGESQGVRRAVAIIADIDAALAEPEPDAMEIVQKIRYPKYTQIDAITSSMTWFTDDQAAALIESYGRRVPRAMLADIYCLGWTDSRKNRISEDHSAIADKYGVKLEG